MATWYDRNESKRDETASMKPLSFLGDSLDGVRAFPDEARREAGFQLDRVQRGDEPDDWKPMKTVGPGVREIRIHDTAGVFRVIYITLHRWRMP